MSFSLKKRESSDKHSNLMKEKFADKTNVGDDRDRHAFRRDACRHQITEPLTSPATCETLSNCNTCKFNIRYNIYPKTIDNHSRYCKKGEASNKLYILILIKARAVTGSAPDSGGWESVVKSAGRLNASGHSGVSSSNRPQSCTR